MTGLLFRSHTVRGLFIPLVLVFSGCAGEADDASRPGLKKEFHRAADKHDVPVELLMAIGWSQTRFEGGTTGGHVHEGRSGFGVMDLRAGAPANGPSLERAARRIGVTVEEIRTDRDLNIEAAASELRWRANTWEAQTGVAIVDLGDWAEVIGWFSGSDDGGAQRSFAKQVYTVLEGGLSVQTPSGEWLDIDSAEQDVPFLDAWLSGGMSDSPLVANFVAAHPTNYTNASRSGAAIDTIVVHTAQGSYSGTYNWFANSASNVSAHYVIRSSDGEITQMVWEEDTAWHAGHSSTNGRSVGIELEGYVERPDLWFTDAMYRSLTALIQDIADRQGVALDRDWIIGHVEVPGCSSGTGGGYSCHTDPGTGFDWDRLVADLGVPVEPGEEEEETEPPSGPVGELVGFIRAHSIYNDAGGIPNATVSLSTGGSTVTDGDGWYVFDAVSAGWIDISVSASGYDTGARTTEIDVGITNWGSVALNGGGGSSCSGSSSGGGGSSGGGSTCGGTSSSVPTPLNPTGGETVIGPAVTMHWSDTGADGYEVKIYWFDGDDWHYYYAYSTTAPEKTFWPVVDDTSYSWAVRATHGGVTTEWTELETFFFDN
jgi:N-acetyl-anhydromuramyl-L-alanine amidase AmpD